MFDHEHYVPILKLKGAEMGALCKLLSDEVNLITPLIQLCPPARKDLEKMEFTDSSNIDYFSNLVIKAGESWAGAPFFIDTELIETLFPLPFPHPMKYFCDISREMYLKPIPVIGLNRTPRYRTAVKNAITLDKRGVCIRLLEEDFENLKLTHDLNSTLTFLGLKPQDVDILVDLKLIGNASISLLGICKLLPYLSEWRTFTLSSGCFPSSAKDYPMNDEYEISRDDWKFWLNSVSELNGRYRIPTFSDYTIQSPEYSEPPEGSNPSAKIRYAWSDYWVLMRGQALFDREHYISPGFKQYFGLAKLLIQRKEFCGDNYSFGDQYILRCAEEMKNTGNLKTWLEADINHHLTFTARQIVSIFRTEPTLKPALRNTSQKPLPRIWPQRRVSLSSARYQRFLFSPM